MGMEGTSFGETIAADESTLTKSAGTISIKDAGVTPAKIGTAAISTIKLDGAAWALIKAFQRFTELKGTTTKDTIDTLIDADGIKWIVLTYGYNCGGNSTSIATTARHTVTAAKTFYFDSAFGTMTYDSGGFVGIRNITDNTDVYLSWRPPSLGTSSAPDTSNYTAKLTVAAGKQIGAQVRSNDAQAKYVSVVIIGHEE